MTALAIRLAALLGLILVAPLILVLAVAVYLSVGSPVFFRQLRAGQGCQPFELVKLRSMRDARRGDGTPLPDDQRTTRVGTILRRTRLDELPGLWNIVRGDMAFVGPRPLLPETIAGLGQAGKRRCEVKPGLTGWSQVNGNTLLSLEKKVALDIWYIENRDWALDARILLRTLLVMVGGERTRPHISG